MIKLTRILPEGNKTESFSINPDQIVWVQKARGEIIVFPATGPEIRVDPDSENLSILFGDG